MYKNILFDFDGTVYDTLEGIIKSVRYALSKKNIDAPDEVLQKFAGPPLFDKSQELFNFSDEEAAKFVSDFRERYLPVGLYESRVFPGISQLLKKLRAAGMKTAVTTLKPEELAKALLQRENMLDMFDAVIGSNINSNSDTKAGAIRKAMKLLGAKTGDTVLIGDTKYDAAGAQSCGIECIGAGYGYASEGELEAAGVRIIAGSVKDLERILLA